MSRKILKLDRYLAYVTDVKFTDGEQRTIIVEAELADKFNGLEEFEINRVLRELGVHR